jgi:hypothetical protein
VGQAAGSYDEVAVYPAALTPSQVITHWVAAQSAKPACRVPDGSGHVSAALQAGVGRYFQFGDADIVAPGVVADSSGACLNGILDPASVSSDSGAGQDEPGAGRVSDGSDFLLTFASDGVWGGETTETWVKTAPEAEGWLITLDEPGSATIGVFKEANSSNLQVYYPNNPTEYDEVAAPIADGQWHQVVLEVGQGGWTLYVDGQLAGSRQVEGVYGGYASTRIGQLAGSYDDVVSYYGELSAGTIAARWENMHEREVFATVTASGTGTESDPVIFTARITPGNPAAGTPTGQVGFIEPGSEFALDVVELDPSGAAVSSISLTPGAHEVLMSYSGDDQFHG